MENKNVKISIIGAGFVGSTTAYAIMMQKLASKLVIVDINKGKAKAEALDIAHSTAFIEDIDVEYGDYEATRDSDIVIITAGPQPKPNESRLDVIDKGLAINNSVVPEIVKYSPNSIIIVVANPLDVLTYHTYKLSGFPKERVMGSGTVIDSARLKYNIGEKYDINYRKITAYILGEHGDSQVVAWNAMSVSGIQIDQYLKEIDKEINESEKNIIAEEVKKVGFDIVSGKGYTSYAIGTAVARIVRAIIEDEDMVLPVSTFYSGEYGIEDVYMSAPCIVGRTGIKKVMEIELSEKEKNALTASAGILKELNKRH